VLFSVRGGFIYVRTFARRHRSSAATASLHVRAVRQRHRHALLYSFTAPSFGHGRQRQVRRGKLRPPAGRSESSSSVNSRAWRRPPLQESCLRSRENRRYEGVSERGPPCMAARQFGSRPSSALVAYAATRCSTSRLCAWQANVRPTVKVVACAAMSAARPRETPFRTRCVPRQRKCAAAAGVVRDAIRCR